MAQNKKIYTTGYTGREIEYLKPLLEKLEAMLIDIRFAPYSRVMHWRKVYLKTLLGKRYRHVPNLGNRTFREKKITIQNLDLGLQTVLSLPQNVVLMCACPDMENCHRRLIAGELSERGFKVFEIGSWREATFRPLQSDLFENFRDS